MRLFKFLVISNELIEESVLIHEHIYTRDNRIINLKNKMFVFNKSEIGLMRIDYPNENTKFKNSNSAYVVIDTNNYLEIIKLISSQQEGNKNFKGCKIHSSNQCVKFECKQKKLCIELENNNINNVRGRTWGFSNDTVGTRHEIRDIYDNNEGDEIALTRKIEPRTGGIVSSALQWEHNCRPKVSSEKYKTIFVPLQHWIKCNSIPNDEIKNKDFSFYHIGHIFDYRREFIGLATKEEQKQIRSKKEPKLNIYRGKRVLGGQEYYSKDLECTCNSNKHMCRECEGVLYIDTKEKLAELYNQLTSNEYKSLITLL